MLRSRYRVKSMIVELKETDILDLVRQVVARRPFALYVYGVINLPSDYLLPLLLKYKEDALKNLINNRIGLVCFDRFGTPVLLLKSDYPPMTLMSYFLSRGESEDVEESGGLS